MSEWDGSPVHAPSGLEGLSLTDRPLHDHRESRSPLTQFVAAAPWDDPVFRHLLTLGVGPLAAVPSNLGNESGGSVQNVCQIQPPKETICEECVEGYDGPIATPSGLKDQGGLDRNVARSGVRYHDGTFHLPPIKAIHSTGFGTSWPMLVQVTTLDYGCYDVISRLGIGTFTPYLPYLLPGQIGGTDYVGLITSGLNQRWFLKNAPYTPYFAGKETLSSATNRYTVTDTTGNRLVFFDISTNWPAAQQGQLETFTDVYGTTMTASYESGTGKLQKLERTAGGVTERYTFTLQVGGPNAGLITDILLERQLSGSWVPVEKTVFSYYVSTDLYGTNKNLKTITQKRFKDQGGGSYQEITYDTWYFRYYDEIDQTDGELGQLKYFFSAASYARLQSTVTNPLAATDDQAKPYADYYLKHGGTASKYVAEVKVQGAGCSCGSGGGLGTYSYLYEENLRNPLPAYNVWHYRTVETLPDGNENVVYANYHGQVMLKDFGDPTGLPPTNPNYTRWVHWWKYFDSTQAADRVLKGRAILHAMPSAIRKIQSGSTYKYYDDAQDDLLKLETGNNYLYLQDATDTTDRTAFLEAFDYYPLGNDLAGYFKEVSLKRGELGTPVKLRTVNYATHTSDAGAGGVTIVVPTSDKVYRDTAAVDPQETTFAYQWHSNGSNVTNQIKRRTATLPTVTAAQNGPDAAVTREEEYDVYGRLIWERDEDQFLHYTAYDLGTSAVTRRIVDVDTDLTADFQNLPAGWSNPNGLHLKTDMTVDTLGRTTLLTTPEGHKHYTVYNDAAHETRTYPGWYTVTVGPTTYGYTTGPIQVRRAVRPVFVGSAVPLPYHETLTHEIVLASTDSPATLSAGFTPLGTETISVANLHSLGRQRTNAAGQLTESQRFVSFSGMTQVGDAGTLNTNYHASKYGYDARGRRARTETPTGTIERTVYDGLSRVVSTWIGTNDTPTSGEWSPTNNTPPANMTKVRDFIYDSYGAASAVGDGNLTQLIEHPGTSLTDRKTEHFYDWRNRRVASKSGVDGDTADTVQRLLTYVTYDNLDRVTTRETYDGDSISTPLPDANTDGVPDRPHDYLTGDKKLRTRSAMQFDKQNRVFLTYTYNVDQGDGTYSEADTGRLRTHAWYNKRGQAIKTIEPGGLVRKTQYDGADRVTKTFASDGGSDLAPGATDNWVHATHVTGDAVLSQAETQYDKDGNAIFSIHRERFHDEAATGELASPAVAPKARVYYVARWYDKAERPTEQKNYGTCGGSVLATRDTVPPVACSTAALVTTTGYKADDVQRVALTGAGSFTLTFSGQPTAALAHTATAAQVRTALENLSNLDPGDVFVAGPAGGPWNVRFAGATRGESNQPQMTAIGIDLAVAVVTTTQGGDAGRVQKTIDPRGHITKTDHDPLSRTVRTVEAYTDFVPSGADDRTTEYTYDGSDKLRTLTARRGDGSGQTTQYTYAASKLDGNEVYSNELLTKVQHPHKDTGQPGTGTAYEDVYLYNAVGQEKLARYDRNGTQHLYSYDVLGRRTVDFVTPGTGVDSLVAQMRIQYDTAGRPFRFTSDDSQGSPLNQVERVYNGFGQLTTEYQATGGAVVAGTTPKVDYVYSVPSATANHSRLVTLKYPNTYPTGTDGRALNYHYTGTLNDAISRLSTLANGGTTYEQYTYLGLSTVVQRVHNQGSNDIGLTYLAQGAEGNGEAGDKYAGLDRFGRVIDQRWVKFDDVANPLDRFQYGYDKNSNRLYRENVVSATFSELYHSGGGYDKLNQLTGFQRGTLNPTKDGVTGTPQRTQSWSLDEQGNWNTFTTDGVPQNRTHNYQNQATQVGGNTLTFDDNGNTKVDETGRQYVYDAWNRLVEVKTSGGTRIARFSYDALGRRVKEENGTTKQFYYTAAWQLIEERHGTSPTQAKMQYVWSPVYVDALVLRDRDTDDNGSLEERLYVIQDANWNVTAVMNPAGGVQERYVYDPYGLPTRRSATWGDPGSDSIQWLYLHQGGRYFRFDVSYGIYHFRRRELTVSLGRWMQMDPIGFEGEDPNLYAYVGSQPTTLVDPSGLWPPPSGGGGSGGGSSGSGGIRTGGGRSTHGPRDNPTGGPYRPGGDGSPGSGPGFGPTGVGPRPGSPEYRPTPPRPTPRPTPGPVQPGPHPLTPPPNLPLHDPFGPEFINDLRQLGYDVPPPTPIPPRPQPIPRVEPYSWRPGISPSRTSLLCNTDTPDCVTLFTWCWSTYFNQCADCLFICESKGAWPFWKCPLTGPNRDKDAPPSFIPPTEPIPMPKR